MTTPRRGVEQPRAGKPFSILVPPDQKAGWDCDKRVHSILFVGCDPFCSNCGRPVRIRYRTRPGRPRPEYLRTHSGGWGFRGAC